MSTLSSTEESLKVLPLTANQNLNNLNVNTTTTNAAEDQVENVKISDNIEIIEKPHEKSEKSELIENVDEIKEAEKMVTLTTSTPSSSSINDSDPSTDSTPTKPTSQSSDDQTKSTTQSSESIESAQTTIAPQEMVTKEKEGRAISFPLTVNVNNDTHEEHTANSNIENIPRNDAPINFVTSTTERAGKSKFMDDLSDVNMDEEQDMLFNSANSGKKKDKFKEHMLSKKKVVEKEHKQETIICMSNGKVYKVMKNYLDNF